ncbi:MAG: hypothetical protein M1269_01940 [Chloroflexi bacterium]|nr:hypothetical protein [Chloroflexota bacterium]
MLSYCEVMAGADWSSMCGARPIGSCIACGLMVCRSHSEVINDRIFCIDCAQVLDRDRFKTTARSGQAKYGTSQEPGTSNSEIDSVILSEMEDTD